MGIYGEQGAKWLADLLKIINILAASWQLSHLEVVNNLSYHCVLTGKQGDQPIILKLGLDYRALTREALVLKAFQGYGCVRLLDQNNDYGALLMERAMPGYSLKSLFPDCEEEAIQITSQMMTKLHHAPVPSHLQILKVDDWLAALDKDQVMPLHYLQKARKLKQHLLETSAQPVLLHGDLHHDNILLHEKGWVAIDPKGVIGEAAYEVAAFIRNPLPDLLETPNVQDLIDNRIQRVAKFLNLDPLRLRHWSYVQAVLATIWALEDGLDPKNFIRLIELFD